MARALTSQDAHALMNMLVHQATGQDQIQVTDTSSFVSAGETVLATGLENTMNALSIIVGRTLIAVRPYQAKLQIINALNTDLYTSRLRKISFYTRDVQAAGDWNTDLYAENLKDGVDNGAHGTAPAASLPSMWEQNQGIPLEMNFAGQSVWDDSNTVYLNQLKVAFRDEASFNKFMAGIVTEKANDHASVKEAWNRSILLNRMAGQYDLATDVPESSINMTSRFNQYYGTSYTTQDLLTTYLDQFLAFFISEFKIISDKLENRTNLYHWAPSKPGHILARHTPKSRQRAIMFTPLFTRAKAQVLPGIFNPQYLNVDQFEGVTYWQSNKPGDEMKIKVKPAIVNTANPAEQTVGADVELDHVLGCLYDVDAIMTDFQYESAMATPIEARKRYYNMWYHWSKNQISDYTENFILFYMAD